MKPIWRDALVLLKLVMNSVEEKRAPKSPAISAAPGRVQTCCAVWARGESNTHTAIPRPKARVIRSRIPIGHLVLKEVDDTVRAIGF